jgi:tetratricopeptide (TPR) repeat protein
MKRAAQKRVEKAIALNLSGKSKEALRILDDLIHETLDHSDKFGLLYYEMIWLLDLGAASQARARFNEMQLQRSLIAGSAKSKNSPTSIPTSPKDTDQDDLAPYLAVIARFAEAKLLIKERNEALALDVLEDLMDQYPKQLSLRKFRELRGEADTDRGMLLGNAGRWVEAGLFLERAIAPKTLRPLLCFYLGQYYYTKRDYKRAAKKLKECFTKDMPSQWRCGAHYMLGIAEHYLSHAKEAKNHLELSIRTDDPEFMRKYNIWSLLEEISRVLKQDTEAEKYRKLREEAENASRN